MTQPVNLGETSVPVFDPSGNERDIRNRSTNQPDANTGVLKTVDQECVLLIDPNTSMPFKAMTAEQGDTIIRLLKEIAQKL